MSNLLIGSLVVSLGAFIGLRKGAFGRCIIRKKPSDKILVLDDGCFWNVVYIQSEKQIIFCTRYTSLRPFTFIDERWEN